MISTVIKIALNPRRPDTEIGTVFYRPKKQRGESSDPDAVASSAVTAFCSAERTPPKQIMIHMRCGDRTF